MSENATSETPAQGRVPSPADLAARAAARSAAGSATQGSNGGQQ